ncbi:MAG TPA: GNAT family N-acetyltransferase [Victivallales bacterium]|nr:GNAT family N-acetyltransferase [Victivallales bacterium]
MIKYVTNNFQADSIIQAVNIQLKEIEKGFLSTLGENALKLIFKHIAFNRWGIMVLAKDSSSDKVIGYILGTTSSFQLYRDFLIKKFPLIIVHFLPSLLSFRRIKKAIETLRYPVKKLPDNLPTAELLDLAVDSTYHGKGVAHGLFLRLCDEFRKRGINSFKIPTGASLTRAHRFYEKMGATKVCDFELHSGEKTIIYVYTYDLI